MCEAEMQIRALARRRGVAGNATVTTATYNISLFISCMAIGIMETFVQVVTDYMKLTHYPIKVYGITGQYISQVFQKPKNLTNLLPKALP